jgi:hypothetical protein
MVSIWLLSYCFQDKTLRILSLVFAHSSGWRVDGFVTSSTHIRKPAVLTALFLHAYQTLSAPV